MENNVKLTIRKWLEGSYDQQTKDEVRRLIDSDPVELNECFYRSLEFGTGGLRGIMGVGTNRMNVYTVGMATQGLANYLLKSFTGQIKVAIAYDCRNNSQLFARTTAEVFAANGMTVYLFDALRPTPELSFAVRELGCQSGVVITASHNPKEYNGYKAYWNDGAQVIAPHDENIIREVNKIESIDQVKRDVVAGGGLIIPVGEELDQKYLAMVHRLSLLPDDVARKSNIKIVYTPIHGSGVRLVPAALSLFGFTDIVCVDQQCVTDGSFPTVVSPNPEDPAALKMALQLANDLGADMVMATDPDADRQAVAVRDFTGQFRLLNGNECASLLTYYLLSRWSDMGKINGRQFVVKTVVTTSLIERIAERFGVECFDVLTGFKFIADVIGRNEGVKQFIGGGEESFGYLVGDSVRDKDAVSALAIAAQCAAWAKSQGKSVWQLLVELYVEFGLHKEGLVSITRKGQSGLAEIAQMMGHFRQHPPTVISGSEVVEIRDYLVCKKWVSGVEQVIDLPVSDVLQFVTSDGTIVSVRPSGTEPKIKFYFSVCQPLCCVEKYDEVSSFLDAKIEMIKKELAL